MTFLCPHRVRSQYQAAHSWYHTVCALSTRGTTPWLSQYQAAHARVRCQYRAVHTAGRGRAGGSPGCRSWRSGRAYAMSVPEIT
eukprot:1656745-Rhodomonas_salina.2